jgi:hypothetical protein
MRTSLNNYHDELYDEDVDIAVEIAEGWEEVIA